MSALNLTALEYLTSQNYERQRPQQTATEIRDHVREEILALFHSLRTVIRTHLGPHANRALANIDIPNIITSASTIAVFYEDGRSDSAPEAIVCFTMPNENRARFIAVDKLDNPQATIKNSGISITDGIIVLRNFQIQLQHPGSILLRFDEAHDVNDIGLATTVVAANKK
ncbi:hypothetical protein KBB08_01400 [Candidatus Gracilibacteria bacterium]|nr:hypothetical protein [Candidatus Gracilibacteria bacterium]